MSGGALKLTVYCGESQRLGGALVCDLLLALFERHEIAASILMRGMEGFGLRHRFHTDSLLTLSEDLPLVLVAVDEQERIERLLPELHAIVSAGLVTVEPTLVIRDGDDEGARDELGGASRLTAHCARGDRIGDRPAYRAIVELLRAHGVAGATVLLGLDGTIRGSRRRAQFFARNRGVPMLITAVGETQLIAAATAALRPLVSVPLLTVEPIQLCKTNGRPVNGPALIASPDADENERLQLLTILTGEQDRFDGQPLHLHLISELRASRIAGATALRGIWGYSHDGPTHGDRFFALRRQVPVTTIVVDRTERIHDAFAIVDRVTTQAGIVTCGELQRAPSPREP